MINNKLIVIANPIDWSFSHAMADVIVKWSSSDVDVLDLYGDGQQEYLDFEDGLPTWSEKRKLTQEKIDNCNEIILIFPIWWGIFPAVMKNFFDSNFLIWYAFNRNEDGLVMPWLKWKKLSVFCTCNSPETRYSKYLHQYLDLHFVQCCWMEIENFEILWWITFRTDEERKAYLEKAHNLYK